MGNLHKPSDSFKTLSVGLSIGHFFALYTLFILYIIRILMRKRKKKEDTVNLEESYTKELEYTDIQRLFLER